MCCSNSRQVFVNGKLIHPTPALPPGEALPQRAGGPGGGIIGRTLEMPNGKPGSGVQRAKFLGEFYFKKNEKWRMKNLSRFRGLGRAGEELFPFALPANEKKHCNAEMSSENAQQAIHVFAGWVAKDRTARRKD